MQHIRHPISADAASEILAVVMPGSQLVSMAEGAGSYSNTTYALNGREPSGTSFKLVARRYATFGGYDLAAKARREYRTLEVLYAQHLPVPEPLLLDAEGVYLGSPGIVTRFVEGESISEPTEGVLFPESLARALAAIHAVPCESFTGVLLDGRAEVLWFLKDAAIPPYMASHPLGPKVWEALQRLASRLTSLMTSLVHVDYWTGNILWRNGNISAVLDWEEAACGEPGMDVAYCQMELTMSGHTEAARAFLAEYERMTGKLVANLVLWQLAASVRPMFAAEAWSIAVSPYKERLEVFVNDALERA